MLPIALVLLVATSALAAPGVNVIAASINDVAPPKNPGKPVSSYVVSRAMDINDGGSTNVYTLTASAITANFADLPEKRSQALALGQTIAILGPLSTGVAGDACAAANFINAYTYAIQSKNFAGVKPALLNYIANLSKNIEQIALLASNPNSARFAVGARGNCNGGGRTYSFESAWDAILSAATPNSASLYNEQYCAAKRLYNAFNRRSNNVGAELTAVSLQPIVSIFKEAIGPVARFVGGLPSGGSPSATNAAIQALNQAARNYSC